MSEIVTLKENKEFRRLYTRGRSYVSAVLVSYVVKNRSKNIRIGITTSKKIGNAVKRNRARRVILESFRMIRSRLKPGYDFVFVARGKTPYVKSSEVFLSMEDHMEKAGVLRKSEINTTE